MAARMNVDMRHAADILIVSGIIMVALLIRIPNMNRGLGQDELFTAVNFVDVNPFWRTMTSNAAFNNHTGYSVLARISQSLFGHTEFALRTPALIFGLVSIVIGYACAKSYLTRPWAAVFAAGLAISPAHALWSVQGRGYSGMICLTMISTCLYFRLRKAPTRATAIAYIFACVLCVYVHLYGIFVIVLQIAFYLGDQVGIPLLGERTPESDRMLWRCFLSIGALLFVLEIPLLRSFGRDLIRRGHSTFDVSFPWRVIVELSGIDQPAVASIIAFIAAIGGVILWNSNREFAIYSLLFLTAPLVVMWLARPFDLYPRFFAFWLPHMVFLFVFGIRAIWRAPLAASSQFAARVVACALLVFVVTGWIATRQNRVVDEGYREASLAATRRAGPSTGLCAIGGARTVWRYYIKQPLLTPRDLREFDALSDRYDEVRCVYYEASWEAPEQQQIAAFLRTRGKMRKVNEQISWFAFRKNNSHP
jgi:hypothetical protein